MDQYNLCLIDLICCLIIAFCIYIKFGFQEIFQLLSEYVVCHQMNKNNGKGSLVLSKFFAKK